MTIDELLGRLDGVRKSGRGWIARCPAHDDHWPSLSVSEGLKGLLVKCFAGCELPAICASIGITTHQLFFDDNGPVDRQAIRRNRARRQAAQIHQRARGRRSDAFREAQAVIRAAINPGLAGWSDEQIDAAMDAVCHARELLLGEETNAA